ncbi:MAG: hypothetical protein PHN49_01250 [Candidatus Omnitrophica bacterium]|nr:hypothetical protein [Candidatus Omnitrophota bacterium]
MSCPKCGYSGHNSIFHWGTDEVECEKCRHDYVPKKQKKETPLKFMPGAANEPLLSSRLQSSPTPKCPNPLGEEMVMAGEIAKALKKSTGLDAEGVFRATNGLSDFSSMLNASKNLVGGDETAGMLSRTFGLDPERAWMMVNGPKLNY